MANRASEIANRYLPETAPRIGGPLFGNLLLGNPGPRLSLGSEASDGQIAVGRCDFHAEVAKAVRDDLVCRDALVDRI